MAEGVAAAALLRPAKNPDKTPRKAIITIYPNYKDRKEFRHTLIFSLFHKRAGRSPADMGKGLKGIFSQCNELIYTLIKSFASLIADATRWKRDGFAPVRQWLHAAKRSAKLPANVRRRSCSSAAARVFVLSSYFRLKISSYFRHENRLLSRLSSLLMFCNLILK